MAHVTELYRYPVKGLSAEPVARMALDRRDGLAGDRGYALALGSTRFDPERPEPLDKGHFLMLRANESLAALQAALDPGTQVLRVRRAGREALAVDLATPDGREAAGEYFTAYAGSAARGHVRVVAAPGHRFTDVSVVSPAMMRAVSVVNLASVRALEQAAGRALHPLRFRANIHLDGLAPWEELGWVGREVRIGGARLRGVLRTRRCAAVDVDPVTAARDTNLIRILQRGFGHPDLGLYLEVVEEGQLGIGDEAVPA